MNAASPTRDTPFIALGRRRGIFDLARFAIDLTWARAGSESAARPGGYPSPPMSGSPPLPPKAPQEAAGHSQGTFPTTTQDAYRGLPSTQADSRMQAVAPMTPALGQPFGMQAQERPPYAFSRSEGPLPPRPLSYPGSSSHMLGHQPYLPGPAPIPVSSPYAAPPLPGPPQESPQQASPKTQRKTKGHVASACVPCKRAHLRCDSQRPCSRCLSNGKEDACVDVQHKKRGRPRLRDDRETRFDATRFGQPAETAMRRPMSLYAVSPSTASTSFEDPLRRGQGYRVLKSQPPESMTPRFLERGSAADANIFPPPLSISTRAPEPAALLTMDLEFVKASNAFLDAVGRHSLKGVKLLDILVPSDRDKVVGYHRQMQDDQRRKDPTYLPPIFGKPEVERVIQALGLTPEELARYPTDRQDFFVFTSQDGQQRNFSVRLGLGKQDSVYFVVLALNMSVRTFQPPTPSPNPREMYSYQPMPQPYSQPTPVSATFDPRQSRLGETGYGQRQPVPVTGAPPPQLVSNLSPGISPGLSSAYAASPSRPDYPLGPSSFQIPRSELPPPTRPPQPPSYQLPPIRSQQQATAAPQHHETSHQADRSRVDIGGLIDQPEPTTRP